MGNLDIFKRAKDTFLFMSSIRQKIHKHPELGLKEYETSKFIMEILDRIGIPYRSSVGGTGVVGIIKGKKGDGKCIGIRADMDGLPIQEENTIPYKSEIPNVMHACGHDGHTAILLGTGKILKELEDEFAGSVKLIFQPAEEGPGGALPMIKEGILKDPDVSFMLGLHLFPGRKAGNIIVKSGVFLAGNEEFEISITGKGTHGASPHKGIDTILLSSRVVMDIHQIISRYIDPLEPAVITIGMINGGSKNNIIPDKVALKGTIRYFKDKIGEDLKYWLTKTVKGAGETGGGKGEIIFIPYYPPLINDKDLADKACNYIKNFLGGECLEKEEEPKMWSEDFSYFNEYVPSLFLGLGAGEDESIYYPLHSAKFNFDENAMINGAAVFSKITLELLAG